MNGSQAPGGNIFDLEEVGQVSAGIMAAKQAVAGGADGGVVDMVFSFVGHIIGVEIGLPDIDLINGGSIVNIKAFVTGITSRKDAVENGVTQISAGNNVFRPANS